MTTNPTPQRVLTAEEIERERKRFEMWMGADADLRRTRRTGEYVSQAMFSAFAAWLARAALELQVQPSDQHDWFIPSFMKQECCRKCGIVRRVDDKNKPCRGQVRIALRETPDQPRDPAEERARVRALALEEAANYIDSVSAQDHSECGHGDGYFDGRADAAACVRALIDKTEGGVT